MVEVFSEVEPDSLPRSEANGKGSGLTRQAAPILPPGLTSLSARQGLYKRWDLGAQKRIDIDIRGLFTINDKKQWVIDGGCKPLLYMDVNPCFTWM